MQNVRRTDGTSKRRGCKQISIISAYFLPTKPEKECDMLKYICYECGVVPLETKHTLCAECKAEYRVCWHCRHSDHKTRMVLCVDASRTLGDVGKPYDMWLCQPCAIELDPGASNG